MTAAPSDTIASVPSTATVLRRWVPWSLGGETLGFLAPAAVGPATYALTTPPVLQAALLIVAGVIEGAALGAAQSVPLRALIPGFDARSWVRNTALAAGFAWTIGMVPATLGEAFLDYWYITIPAAVVLAPALLLSIGAAQYLVLRKHVASATLWIWANAGAWLVGIAWVFVAMAFVSEGDPTWRIAAAGIAGGVLMAATVAVITGFALAHILGAPLTAKRSGPYPHPVISGKM